jgi:hypothetical protein
MSGGDLAYLALVLGAFAFFAILLFTLEQTERRKLARRNITVLDGSVNVKGPANDRAQRHAA